MPDTPEQIEAKLILLREIANPRIAELVRVGWPAPDGPIYYASVIAQDILESATLLAQLDGPIQLRFAGNQFLDVTHESGIADDKVQLHFWDADQELSRLAHTHGEGARVEVFSYFPDVDLLWPEWWGHFRPPDEADCEWFKASAQSGFRSSLLPLPGRPSGLTSCDNEFGGTLTTQEEINEGGCPYSAHLGGTPSARFGSDTTWLQTNSPPGAGWQDLEFDDSGWGAAVDEGAFGVAPWGTTPAFPAGTPAHWIWSHDSTSSFDNQTVWFRKTFTAAETQALFVISADGYFTAYLNGQQIAVGGDWRGSVSVSLNLVVNDEYVLAIEVGNAWVIATPGGLLVEVAYGIQGIGFGLMDPETDLPFTHCLPKTRAACLARIGDTLSFLASDTIVESHVVHETKGPNITVTSRGNETNLARPWRVIAGKRHVKDLDTLAYTVEPNTNHPDQGSARVLKGISEGPNKSVTNCTLMGNTIAPEHLNIRLGEKRQGATSFSPGVSNYSSTSLFYGVVQGDFTKAGADDLPGECDVEGLRDVRHYSDENTFAEQYSQDRAWWLMHCSRNKRWGEGYDVARFNIQKWIALSAWFAELVSFTDSAGVHYTGPRSTFNAELIDRNAQQQIRDICLAGRCSLPFPNQGLIDVVPLKRATSEELAAAPVFTDEGSGRNICVNENGKPTLKRSVQSDAELANRILLNLDDEEHDNAQIPLKFESELQQRKAGRAFGDSTRRRAEQTYTAFGITNIGEAGRLGNLLLNLGEFDEGGLENNLRITFITWYLEALEVRKCGFIKVLSSRLDRYGFQYFRVRTMTRMPDLKMEISAQAYPVEYYDLLESLETPPPIPPSPVLINPGGGPGVVGSPGIRPVVLGFDELEHFDDRIRFVLEKLEV